MPQPKLQRLILEDQLDELHTWSHFLRKVFVSFQSSGKRIFAVRSCLTHMSFAVSKPNSAAVFTSLGHFLNSNRWYYLSLVSTSKIPKLQ